MKSFLGEMVRIATKSDSGYAIEVEGYASTQLKQEMERLRKDSNVERLSQQEKEIAALKKEKESNSTRLGEQEKEIATLKKELDRFTGGPAAPKETKSAEFLREDFSNYDIGAFPDVWGGEASVIGLENGKCLGTQRPGTVRAISRIAFPENWSLDVYLQFGKDSNANVAAWRKGYYIGRAPIQGADREYGNLWGGNRRQPLGTVFTVALADKQERTWQLDVREIEVGNERCCFNLCLSSGEKEYLPWPVEKIRLIKRSNSLAIEVDDKPFTSGRLSGFGQFSILSISLYCPDSEASSQRGRSSNRQQFSLPIWVREIRGRVEQPKAGASVSQESEILASGPHVPPSFPAVAEENNLIPAATVATFPPPSPGPAVAVPQESNRRPEPSVRPNSTSALLNIAIDIAAREIQKEIEKKRSKRHHR